MCQTIKKLINFSPNWLTIIKRDLKLYNAISCYMISNGAMNIEQQHTADSLFASSVSEVAKELGVDQEEDIQNNDDG